MAATKRAERRAENAALKALRICIDCYDEHSTGFMRCEPCSVRNRGGARKYGDIESRLQELNAIELSGATRWERRRIYFAKRYCHKMLSNPKTQSRPSVGAQTA